MGDIDPLKTQRDVIPEVTAQLVAAGFADAEEIGRGGFGVVYRCSQVTLDRMVAVKVLTADLDESNRERFVREQQAMGRLTGHPNIVGVLEVGTTTSGLPYLVIPYYPEDSLDTRIRRHGPLSSEETLRLGVKLAGALATAHRLGILHRDVKPSNILITDYGEPTLTTSASHASPTDSTPPPARSPVRRRSPRRRSWQARHPPPRRTSTDSAPPCSPR